MMPGNDLLGLQELQATADRLCDALINCQRPADPRSHCRQPQPCQRPAWGEAIRLSDLESRYSNPSIHFWKLACAGLQELKATLDRLSDARQQVEKLENEEGQSQAALLQTEISILESRRRAQELQQQVVKLAEDMKVRAHALLQQ